MERKMLLKEEFGILLLFHSAFFSVIMKYISQVSRIFGN